MDRRRYFSSCLDEYNFPEVRPQSYLYVYKHNYPQIIVRFPNPTKTITGYRLYHAQIFYHPFYQELDQQNNKNSDQKYKTSKKLQKLNLQYQGQIILSLQISIFNEYFQEEVLNHLKQCQTQNRINLNKNQKINKKHSNQHSFHLDPNMYSRENYCQYGLNTQKKISQIFEILIKQWLKDPLISSMFIISEKHLQTVESYDHGFIKLQILKTSDKTLKAPFHRYMIQRNWMQQQISNYYKVYQNKVYYFQFQSSIFFTQNHEYHDVQKLGFVVPNPITINQFFYETLLMIFCQFQAAQKEKQDKKKRQEERIRNREALLQNLRKIGVQGQLPDLNNFQQIIQELRQNQDSLDKKLQQLLSNDRHDKNLLKNISYVKGEMSYTEHLSTFHNHNQSYFQNSPRRRLSTKLSDMRQEESKQDESKINRNRSPTLNNVKIIRSFTSELLDQDFQQKPKRRFITRQQYFKILEFNERLIKKKQEKQKKNHGEQNKTLLSPKKKIQQVVYIGPEIIYKKSSMKKNQYKVDNDKQFKYDFFAMHQQKIISEDQPLNEPEKYSWQEDDKFQSYDYYQDSQQRQESYKDKKSHLPDQQYQFQRKNGFSWNSSFMDNYNQ